MEGLGFAGLLRLASCFVGELDMKQWRRPDYGVLSAATALLGCRTLASVVDPNALAQPWFLETVAGNIAFFWLIASAFHTAWKNYTA